MESECVRRCFEAGEHIVEAGSQNRDLYVICSGDVRLVSPDSTQEPLLGSGDLFGELTSIIGLPAAYTAIAETAGDLLQIDLPGVNQLCVRSPEFAFRLIRHLAQRLAAGEVESHVIAPPASGPQNVLEALATVILENAASGESPAVVEGPLLELSRQAGLSIREAYTALHLLLDKHWVVLADDCLSVIEREELTKIASAL